MEVAAARAAIGDSGSGRAGGKGGGGGAMAEAAMSLGRLLLTVLVKAGPIARGFAKVHAEGLAELTAHADS
eukprot:6206005-Pleurochrysis_carterae.AAC.1